MSNLRTLRLPAIVLSLCFLTAPAFAVSKDMVQLQTQIQQLQDAVARLQQSNDERMGVLRDLVQQSADSVNRMSVNMDTLQKQLATQQAAEGTKVDQVSGQISALNDSLDEIKARMVRLEKVLANVESQQQGMSAGSQPAALSSTGAATTPSATTLPAIPETSSPVAKSVTPVRPLSKPSAALPAAAPSAALNTAPSAAPAADLYKAAYGDYIAAKYPLAISEFEDVIKNYPDNSLAGNAYYYMGEIDFRAAKYAAAAKDYDRVLEQFPDNNKIPAAHLHKGQALIALKQNDAGVRELRTLIQRFPSSPEATQARSKLSGMGVSAKVKP